MTVDSDIVEKNVEEYPCPSEASNIHDIVLPIAAKSMYEAKYNCAKLGGKLYFPSKEEDILPFVEEVKSNLDKVQCKKYVWTNFFENSYDGNNWTIYHNDSTYYLPPFEYPGWLEFAVGQPNGRDHESCAVLSLEAGEPTLLHDVSCNSAGYCYQCR